MMGMGDLQQSIYSRDYQQQLGQAPVPLKLIYAITTTAGTITLNGTNIRQGSLYNAGSPYVGRSLRKITVLLRTAAGAPTDFSFAIRDSGDAIVWQSSLIIAAGTLTNTFRNVSMMIPSIKIPSAGRVLVESTTVDASNTIQVCRTSAANVLDVNTLSTVFAGSYTDSVTRTMSLTLWE